MAESGNQRRCSRCRHRTAGGKGGGSTLCGECRRAYRRDLYKRNKESRRAQVYEASISRRFGTTKAAYEELLTQQDGRCAICGRGNSGRNRDGSARRLHIDHDHKSGTIRGLLCSSCNSGLAPFREDPGRMMRAVLYLGLR